METLRNRSEPSSSGQDHSRQLEESHYSIQHASECQVADTSTIQSMRDYYHGIAASMLTKIPRELRNRIYTVVVQGSYDNEVIVRRRSTGTEHFTLLTRTLSGLHSIQWVEEIIVPYMNAEYVGKHMASEMLEVYYWTRIFKFSHEDIDLIGNFIKTDTIGLGMIPADHIRRLHVQIKPFPYSLCSTAGEDQERCLRGINSLKAMKTAHTEVTVHVDLAYDIAEEELEMFAGLADSYLSSILQAVKRLRDRGLKIQVEFSDTWDRR